MQEENKDIHEDLFSGLIREKIQDHRLPVDESDWLLMQERMKQANRHRQMRNVLRIGLSAAAVIALVFYLIPIPQLSGPELPGTECMQTLLPPAIEPLPTEEPCIKKESISSPVVSFLMNQPAGKSHTFPSQTESGPDDTPQITEPETEEPGPVEFAPEPNGKPADLASTYLSFGTTNDMIASYPSRQRSGRWQLSTGVSTSSRGSWFREDADWVSGIDKEPGEEEEGDEVRLTRAGHAGIQQRIEEEYQYDSHALPFTVGFMVRGHLTDRLSIETGIVYTYLSSRLTKTGGEARLKQHYIGIPVNLICPLWEQDNWQFYLSAGGTIEKGVHLALHEQGVKDGVVYERNMSSGISSIQASAQVSPGIEYAFSQDWSIYLEPRISYYFKNNQPPSARTEHPLTFGIGGGLRYTF